MTYTASPAPLLGPARCQGCGELVWWAQRMSRRLGINAPRMGWREDDGVLHRCPNAPIMMSETGRSCRSQHLRPGPSHS